MYPLPLILNILLLGSCFLADSCDGISSVNSPGTSSQSSFVFPEISEDLLASFALPIPYAQAHTLASSQLDVVMPKLKEVIARCQQSDLTSDRSFLSDSTTLMAGTRDQVTSPDWERASSPGSDGLPMEDTDARRCGSSMSRNSTQSEDAGPQTSDPERRESFCTLTGRSVSPDPCKSPDPSKCIGLTDTTDETSLKDGSLADSRTNSRLGVSRSSQDNDSVVDGVYDFEGASQNSCDTPKPDLRLTRTGSMDTASRDFPPASSGRPHAPLKRRDTEMSIRTQTGSRQVTIMGQSGESSQRDRYGSTSAGSVAGTGTLRGVKSRSNPSATLSTKKKNRPGLSTGVFSPAKKVNTKMVKLVLAGNDHLVSSVAQAYTRLVVSEPSLLSGLEVLFYHIPLCQASTVYTVDIPQVGANADLPEPFCATSDFTGNSIHIGRFLSYMDSWYERNVMLAVHNTLRIIPTVS